MMIVKHIYICECELSALHAKDYKRTDNLCKKHKHPQMTNHDKNAGGEELMSDQNNTLDYRRHFLQRGSDAIFDGSHTD